MSILFSHFLSENKEIRPQEADFTEVLEPIALKPKMLYFYGKMPKNRPKTVAIVGTRKPTGCGREVAYDLAYAVAKKGGIVASGMAFGIDSIAHRGALDAGGVTVAVLGTPIDYIYPKQHFGLAEEIVQKGGIVMSELPPGANYHHKTCFLRRNRIISGLADVVVVVEAAERSGSLNTAAHALEQGREIFAVPGDITRPGSQGCNNLIAKGGALVYTRVDDVLEALFPVSDSGLRSGSSLGAGMGPVQVELFGDSEAETAILRVLAEGIEEGEEIMEKSSLSVSEFNCNITLLEIKGRVRGLGMNRWALK